MFLSVKAKINFQCFIHLNHIFNNTSPQDETYLHIQVKLVKNGERTRELSGSEIG